MARSATATNEDTVRNNISLRFPDDVATLIHNNASNEGLRESRWVLKLVYDTLGMEMPKAVRVRAPKYATDEERQAAKRASIARRTEKIKNSLALLDAFEKFKRGEITLEEFTNMQTNVSEPTPEPERELVTA